MSSSTTVKDGASNAEASNNGTRSRFGTSPKISTQTFTFQEQPTKKTMPGRKVKLCTCGILATLLVIAISLSVIFIMMQKKASKAEPHDSCIDLSSSPICMRTNPYPFYGTKTDYIVAKDSLKETGTSGNKDVCTPKQLYLFSRHAARFPDAEKIEEMIEKLPKLIKKILEATPHDSICDKFKMDLRDWKISMSPSDDNSLSSIGKKQSQELGERLRTRFPTLFNKEYTQEEYEFGYTSRDRTRETAEAFAKGAFVQELPSLDNLPIRDDILQFHKTCEQILKKKGWKKQKHPEITKFQKGNAMERIVKDMSQRLGISMDFDTLKLMFSICQFEYSMTGDSVWCPLFKTVYVKVFEYLDDLDDFYEDSYGRNRNYEQACPMVENLMMKFGSMVNGTGTNPSAVLMFSHAGAIKKVISRFGLFEDDSPLKADGFCTAEDRKWRSSLICPFNANLAFVLYECSGQYFVQAFLQEKAVVLKGCSTSLCPWPVFENYYSEIARNCDLNRICTP